MLRQFDQWLLDKGINYLREITSIQQEITDANAENKMLSSRQIVNEFSRYEREHVVVPNLDYLCMLGTAESYRSPIERLRMLDNQTYYQESTSTDRIAVYKKGFYSIQNLFICIHGTKVSSLEDIRQDIQLISGTILNTDATTKYLNDIKLIIDSYPNIGPDNIYICGHSLSSYYALVSGFIFKCNVRNFNGANTLLELSKYPGSVIVGDNVFSIVGINDYFQVRSYRVAGDIVSLLSKFTVFNMITLSVENMPTNPLVLHTLSYMISICIPRIPLSMSSLSRARRFANDDTPVEDIGMRDRSQIPLEQVIPSPRPLNIFPNFFS